MKEKYWDWLKKKLGEAWKPMKIIPFALWGFLMGIGSTMKKMTVKEVTGAATWDNLCVMSGVICCLTFIILIAGFWWLTLAHFVGTLILCAASFLISTYAYWRGKP